MAKQRGIHQLSGTVNNMVYYSKKGTNTGVARRQNEAMSTRLKEGVEFTNTREANSLFGACMMYASIFLNFSLMRDVFLKGANRAGFLASRLLGLIKTNAHNEGYGVIEPSRWYEYFLLNALNSLAKNKLNKYIPTFPLIYFGLSMDTTLDLEFNEVELENYASIAGANGLSLRYLGMGAVYGSTRIQNTGKYTSPEVLTPSSMLTGDWYIGDGGYTLSVRVNGADDARTVFFVGIIPFVEDASGRIHYLNEHASCSYCIAFIS